jgi:hypothetical protein
MQREPPCFLVHRLRPRFAGDNAPDAQALHYTVRYPRLSTKASLMGGGEQRHPLLAGQEAIGQREEQLCPGLSALTHTP